MITNKDIKKAFQTIKPGTVMTVSEIQSFIQNTYQVTAEDLEPYVRTRKTNYPKWHHRIQLVLNELHDKKKVIEHIEKGVYMF